MTCRHCGTEIADKALICFRCGKATAEPRIAPPSEGSIFDAPRIRQSAAEWWSSQFSARLTTDRPADDATSPNRATAAKFMSFQ